MFLRRNQPDSNVATKPDASDELTSETPKLYQPSEIKARRSLDSILLSRGDITIEQQKLIHDAVVKSPGRSIQSIITSLGFVSETTVYSALADAMSLPFESPDRASLDPHLVETLGYEFAKQHCTLPLRVDGGKCVVAITDPANIFLVDEIGRRLNRSIRIVVATPSDVLKTIDALNAPAADVAVDEIIKDMADDDVQVVKEAKQAEANDLEKAGSESPVIKFVNFLIQDAMRQGASDIHIEPKDKALKIRYRIDGLLFEAMNPPHTMHAAVTSRLKIMANLDISERRLPQDGRIRAVVQGRQVDLRMSTLPTAFGEKTCIRILDNRSISVPLEALGFSEQALTIWRNQIDQPHGIILVTGPTGSGKTTTLYSSLRVMDGNEMNISTVEDPIEYNLPTANQVQVHERIGMTFSAALRSLLRQDPDVVMLGEIRDAETARIAVQAALTGHLVLSTLHTNDAPSSVTRLINIGVEPYLISAALNAVLAQRLVRKVCQHCRQLVKPSVEMAEFLQLQGFRENEIWKGVGCDKCRKTGFSGRLGIYEMMVIDDQLRDMITRNPDVNQLRKVCRERGLVSLREDGFDKARAGLTTIDEVLRVTEAG
ncbi:MAG TPA: ATPase, T2SS/T4P/T4SS family [Tepidisphaeraceae bacterium]|nr:ATPase, T2SS/T4P/T4SS family [Tepidisphaeraceae bacterium]